MLQTLHNLLQTLQTLQNLENLQNLQNLLAPCCVADVELGAQVCELVALQ